MKHHSAVLAALSALTFLTPVCVEATVVFSTIDPNATTFTFFGSAVDSAYDLYSHPPAPPGSTYRAWANQISPETSFTLTDISFGLRALVGTLGDVNVVIYPNNPATNLPLVAAPLATSSAFAPEFADTVPLTTASFIGAPVTLIAGRTYWVALEPWREGTSVNWGTTPIDGRVAVNMDGTGLQVALANPPFGPEIRRLGAFRISGLIPEPSTAGMIGAGLLSLLVRRKARRA